MKTATDSPDAGSKVVRTTTTQVLPAETAKKIDFWEYLATLAPHDWGRHILYFYRDDPAPTLQVGKFIGCDVIPWNDREEAEYLIAQKFGGRVFRGILKDGPQWVTVGRINVNAPPRILTPASNDSTAPQVQPQGEGSATERVASQAITTIAGQESAGVRLALDAIATTANVVKSFANQPPPVAPVPSETDNLIKLMMIKMMEKLMDKFDAPPPAAASAIPGVSGDMVQRFFNTVIERGLNPPVVSDRPAGTGAILAGQIPQIGSYVVQAMSLWAQGRAAERDMVLAGARPVPPGTATAAPIPARAQLPAHTPQPNPAPAPANGGTTVGKPSLEFIEQKIMELFNSPLSADEAAEEVLAFLQVMDGPVPAPGEIPMVVQLHSLGEGGLLGLFQNRPTLLPATSNVPRLTEFIRAFLKYAGENAGEVGATTTKPPSLPN